MGLKLEEVVGKKLTEAQFDEAAGKKDACYHKVKARYDVWPSAYASGALVKCRKAGAANWGNKSKKKEGLGDRISKISKKYSKGQKKSQKALKNKKGPYQEGLDEGQKRRASDILRKFDMAYIKFSQEVRDVMKLMDKSTGSRVDGKIINKAYGKHLIPFDDIMQSWARGQQNNPKIDESVNEGPQKDRNELALYIIDLNNMLGQAKISKNPKAKRYIKMIQQDLKDAKKKLSKLKNESIEESYDIWNEDGSFGYTMTGLLPEAEYGGRKVKLGKPMQGDVKKFKVYVKNDKGNVVKVNFGHGGSSAKGKTMKIRKSNPKARKSFRARHNCDNPGPRHKARYWSCRKW